MLSDFPEIASLNSINVFNVSQKFGVSRFSRLSLSNFVQILFGESTRYTDLSYDFQPVFFENLPRFN